MLPLYNATRKRFQDLVELNNEKVDKGTNEERFILKRFDLHQPIAL